MATGPFHYREAEEHVAFAMATSLDSEARLHLAAAQVHATLALAAATALNDGHEGMRLTDQHAWRQVATEPEQSDTDEPAVYQERVDDEHFVEYAGEGGNFTATLKRFDGAEIDDPDDGMTNADVMSGEELDEYDRAAEFALDAADAERYALRDDYVNGDEHEYEADEDEDGDES